MGGRMDSKVYRLFVERRNGFENEAGRVFSELTGFLGIKNLEKVRYLNRYDAEGLDEGLFRRASVQVFSDPHTDIVYFENIELQPDERVLSVEYLPGQYDQRADSAAQCIVLLGGSENAVIRTARVYVFKGALSDSDMDKIRSYLINPVDSRLAAEEKPLSLTVNPQDPPDIPVLDGFTDYNERQLEAFLKEKSLAMDSADIKFLRDYFRKEGRNPTETELRVLDTYWSDHCRHTTFSTFLKNIPLL